MGFLRQEFWSGVPSPSLIYLLVSPNLCICAQSLQSCLTLCDPMECSPPGSSVHGILQSRILEWAAILGCHGLLQGIFPTQGSNQHLLHLLHWQADSLPLCHLSSTSSSAQTCFLHFFHRCNPQNTPQWNFCTPIFHVKVYFLRNSIYGWFLSLWIL